MKAELKRRQKTGGLKLIKACEERGIGTKTGRGENTAEAKATDSKQKKSAVMWKQKAQEV